MLRSVSFQDWGADQHIPLHMYKLFVRSKIDYDCIVYGSAGATAPADPILNNCLRLASGAFKSTPIQSLQIITNELSP